MQVANSGISQYAKDAMSFSFTTSSGDTIDFSSYKEASLKSSSKNDDSGSTKTTELTLSAGYKFHYSGDGIDANDMKEIQDAINKISPDMKDFMQSSGSKDILGRELENLASTTVNKLPQLSNQDSKEMLKDKFLSNLDDIFKMFDQNQKSLDNSKRLLDKIFAKIDGKDRSLYA
jgi:hypothetical protein